MTEEAGQESKRGWLSLDTHSFLDFGRFLVDFRFLGSAGSVNLR